MSITKEQADLFIVLYFPHFLLVGCKSAVTSWLPRSFQRGNVCLQVVMFYYGHIRLQGGGCCRFPSFLVRDTHPADSLLGDVARSRQMYIELVVETLLIIVSSLLVEKKILVRS